MKVKRKVLVVLVLVGVVGLRFVNSDNTQVDSAPVGWWQFDEGQGEIVKDRSLNNNDGAVRGAGWERGLFSSGLRFDGREGYVQIPNSPSLEKSPNNEWSMEVWFYKSGPAKWASDPLVGKTDFSYYLGLWTALPYFDLRWADGSTSRLHADPDIAIFEGKWYYLVGVYDGVAMKLFLNGALVKEEPVRKQIGFSREDIYIGKHAEHRSVFNGIIDEVRFHNRALSAEEINTIYEENKLDKGNLFDLAVLQRDTCDNLYIYLQNPHKEAMEIKEICLDGKNVNTLVDKEEMPIAETRRGKVKWYDVLPDPVPPGGTGVIKIRFGAINEIGHRIKVKLLDKSGGNHSGLLEVVFPAIVEFNSVSFSETLKELWLYLSLSRPAEIEGLFVDSEPVISRTTVREIDFEQKKGCLLCISLSKPLPEGKYKVIKVVTDKGSNACMVKVIKPFFPIGMYHVVRFTHQEGEPTSWEPPTDKELKDCLDHGINTLFPSYGRENPDLSPAIHYGFKYVDGLSEKEEEEGVYSAYSEAKLEAELKRLSSTSFWAWYVWDEPEFGPDPPMEVLRNCRFIRKCLPPWCLTATVHTWNAIGFYEYNFSDILLIDFYPVPLYPLAALASFVRTAREVIKPKPLLLVDKERDLVKVLHRKLWEFNSRWACPLDWRDAPAGK